MTIRESLLRGHARRWIADPSRKKTAVQAGDLLRNLTDVGFANPHPGASSPPPSRCERASMTSNAARLSTIPDLGPVIRSRRPSDKMALVW